MSEHSELQFGPFCLKSRHGPLLKDGVEVRLQPKATALLWALAQQAGLVMSKASLMDAVWPTTVVSEDALGFQVQALRRALGDDIEQPRYIATAHRVGFRFIAPVHRGQAAPATTAAAPLFGRQAELQTLRQLLEKSALGASQQVFITGEAGLGKTALVEAFIAESLARDPQAIVVRGQCTEQSGESEPYRPLLEAMSRLLRDAPDSSWIELMRRTAPSWLLQMPALLPPAEYAALRRTTAGVRKERMLREMAEALDQLGARRQLLLVLEDLHWCDSATLDLLGWLAQQPGASRRLLVVTMRPVDAILAEHPARQFQLALQSRARALELPLAPLDYAAVQQWLAHRLPGEADARRCEKVFERSEGHPLFLTQITQYLVEQGGDAPADELLPQGLQDLILMQVNRLQPAQLRLLEAASVAGVAFSAAAAAAALGIELDAAEVELERLSDSQRFVAAEGLAIWPDGTVSGQFRFRHALYGQVIRRHLPDSRRARLHRLMAERAEAAYGARAPEVASELALHFEQAGLLSKALHYRIHTARKALAVLAFDVVRRDTEHGLTLLASLPAGGERDRAELALRVIAAAAQQAEFGYATAHSLVHFDRIPLLLEGVSEPALLEPALGAMWLQRHFQGRFEDAVWYAGQVRALGQSLKHPVLQACGEVWGSLSLHVMGRVVESARHSTRAARLLAAAGSKELLDCSALLSRSLTRWLLGFADQALQLSEQACALAEELGNPTTLCLMRVGALGSVLNYRRDWARLLAESTTTIELCERYSHRDGLNWAQRQRALALCFGETPQEGLDELWPLVSFNVKQGMVLGVPMDCVHAAEAHLRLGQLDRARHALDQAWGIMRHHRNTVWEPEALRVEGEFLLAEQGPDSEAAESCFLRAAQLARTRRVRSQQLRALLSLARVYEATGRGAQALGLLQPLCASFKEGRQSVDLLDARNLMTQLKTTAATA